VWLTNLEADRLRNLRAVSLRLPAGLTLVAGRNGQGKSSLLEAIYLLGTGRSFRSRRLDDLIHWDGKPLRVAGSVQGRVGRSRLAVVMDGEERRLLADGAEQSLENFIGRLHVVDLTAERMLVLRGGPEERRRFLDRGLVGLRPGHLLALGEYRRVLRQRNALLRSMARRAEGARLAELDVWDKRLVSAGAEIHQSRREYAVLLGAQLGEVGRVLFPGGEEIRLRYRPSPAETGRADAGKIADILSKTLDRERDRDVATGHTGRGPHRDDVELELDGVDLRRFGSAGQLRASMVALKLGKLFLLQRTRGEMPLFLMDDFDSDLDEVRAAALAAFLRDGGFQAFVATSKESMADRLGVNFTKVRMEGGEAIGV
jgi:DNA replication and repair protein RecF